MRWEIVTNENRSSAIEQEYWEKALASLNYKFTISNL